ncbi:MAG: dethiobiotin synthase [Flavobacteriales bacterium]
MKKNTFFITGIDTEIGKTLASTILVEALHADYHKMIQAGIEERDTEFVKSMISNSKSHIHKESVLLKEPMSPHAAAELENRSISLKDLTYPETNNEHLIIEGAGGLMVPFNEKETFVDWLKFHPEIKIIIVSKNYLGSINHTMLTLEVLKQHGIPVYGIIFNGKENKATERVIKNKYSVRDLGRILPESEITQQVVKRYSEQFKKKF